MSDEGRMQILGSPEFKELMMQEARKRNMPLSSFGLYVLEQWAYREGIQLQGMTTDPDPKFLEKFFALVAEQNKPPADTTTEQTLKRMKRLAVQTVQHTAQWLIHDAPKLVI